MSQLFRLFCALLALGFFVSCADIDGTPLPDDFKDYSEDERLILIEDDEDSTPRPPLTPWPEPPPVTDSPDPGDDPSDPIADDDDQVDPQPDDPQPVAEFPVHFPLDTTAEGYQEWCQLVAATSPTLGQKEAEVPNYLLRDMPHQILADSDATQRKNLFVCSLLPHIAVINSEIQVLRNAALRLRKIIEDKGDLKDDEKVWLFARMSLHRLTDFQEPQEITHNWKQKEVLAYEFAKTAAIDYSFSTEDIDRLLYYMDVISPALALAQSAEETGWGALGWVSPERNLFGLVYSSSTNIDFQSNIRCRPFAAGAGHHLEKQCVLMFASAHDSVPHYVERLNVHGPYEKFREMRQASFQSNQCLNVPDALLNGALEHYATNPAYESNLIDHLQNTANLIKYNHLAKSRFCE